LFAIVDHDVGQFLAGQFLVELRDFKYISAVVMKLSYLFITMFIMRLCD